MAKKSKQHDSKAGELRGVDLTEVERLLAFMKKHELEEFEYQLGDLRIRLRKTSSAPASDWTPLAAAPPRSETPAPAAQAATQTSAAEESDAGLHVIKSPIVGTFYSAPSPEAAPFVTSGARVESGQVLCIVEAMKLMNEIESDVAGEVVKVFVANGEPVEYGQPLFGIRANGRQ